jgi:hypothetical protein
MASIALHRLRRHSRRFAAATVAVFALNWLGLALMPCAMAYALPAPVAHAAETAAAPTTLANAMPAGCPGHAGKAVAGQAPSRAAAGPALPPAAPSGDAPAAAAPSAEPCPWCLEAARGGPHHDADCGATPKPALDSRDAKNPVPPLLIALSAAVLGFVPVEAAAVAYAPDDDLLPPATPAVDRYCRRLE